MKQKEPLSPLAQQLQDKQGPGANAPSKPNQKAFGVATFTDTAMNTITSRPGESQSKDERDLARIVALASGLGLGGVLALSQALNIKGPTFSLQFSFITAIAFVVGFAIAFAYLNRILVYREQTSRLFVRGGLLAISFLGLAACLYPLRFKIGESAGGLGGVAIALCFIAGGFTLIRLALHAAERQHAEQEAKERIGANEAARRDY